jgi:hypothetical protein
MNSATRTGETRKSDRQASHHFRELIRHGVNRRTRKAQ